MSKFVKFYKFIYNEFYQQYHMSSLKRIAFIMRNWIPLSLWMLFPANIYIIPVTYLSITAMKRRCREIDTLFYYTLLSVAILSVLLGLYDALTHILQGCFTETEELVWFGLQNYVFPYLHWKYISILMQRNNLTHVAGHVFGKKDITVILCCLATAIWHYYTPRCRWQCCHWLKYLCTTTVTEIYR